MSLLINNSVRCYFFLTYFALNVLLLNGDDIDIADRVKIGVYYESLCPFSKNFLINQVIPTWFKVGKIMDMHLVPFGNSYIKVINNTVFPPEVEFECQHGLKECIGNNIMGCALNILPTDKGFEYIDCIFHHTYWFKPKVAAYECATKKGVDWEKMCSCYTTKEGADIQYYMGNETKYLDPPHSYVPWITFFGKHNKTTQRNAMKDMKSVVCDLYKGERIPECPR